MNGTEIYEQVTSNAAIGSALLLIAIALWKLVFKLSEQQNPPKGSPAR